ncbi:hypothetical protein ABZX51_006838 [Aspergillus tubingensis]
MEATSREILGLRSLMDSLRRENESLTALLNLRGIDDKMPRVSRQAEYDNNVIGNICRDPALLMDETSLVGPTKDTPMGQVSQLCYCPSKGSSSVSFEDLKDSNCLPIPPQVAPISASFYDPGTDVLESILRNEVSEDKYEDTTVCAVALELVMSCNTKNLSILDLDMRLRSGYRSARFQWEGCRVDNQVLFAVLAEIT